MTKIKLGEVEYNLTFNMGFLKMLFKEYGIDAMNIDWQKINSSIADMSAFTEGIFGASVNNSLKQEKKNLLGKDEIELIAEQMHISDMTNVILSFTSWMATPKETVTDPAKKEDGSNAETFHMEQA